MPSIQRIMTPTVRAWLYGIGIAVCALLVAYGVLTDETVLLWNSLIAAVLGIAIGNTPTRGSHDDN